MLYRYCLIAGLLFLFVNSSNGQVTADFVANKYENCGPSQFNFFDQSTSTAGPILSWKWDLSVANSSKQNPGVIFNNPGTYTICLTATDNNGNSDTVCKNNVIQIFENPTADFTLDQTEGCVPLDVTFTDQSTSPNGNIVDWTWSVGGSSGVIQNNGEDVSSSYTQEGSYSASLIVVDEKGCQSDVNFPNLIKANEITLPEISKEILQNCSLPWQVDLNLSNIDNGLSYFWDFGNGQTSNSPDPGVVSYTSAGNFDIKLIVEKPGCRDSVVLDQFVSTFITGEIEIDQESECIGSVINFNTIGGNEGDSLLWDFGDGITSNELSPSHDYNSPGCYTVNLTNYLNGCSQTVTYDCVNIKSDPQLNLDIINPEGCLLPHDVVLSATAQEAGTFSWTFGGESYTGDTINISIDTYGVYPIEFTFESASGCMITRTLDDVRVLDFEILLPEIGPSGCAPYNLIFSDSISNGVPIISYEWTLFTNPVFTSSNPTVNHTIVDTGVYDLQLMVENELGCRDTIFKENYIGVGNPPIVDFRVEPYEQCAYERYFYYDESDNISNGWFWQFGDGDTSLIQNPTNFYEDTGSYQVLLTSFHNGCGSINETQSVYVIGPVSRIRQVYNCDDPYNVKFINESINADTFYWMIEYEPGKIDTIRQDTFDYLFADRGKYPIRLFTENFLESCIYIDTDTVRITDPIAQYTLDTLRGCVPFDLSITDESIDASLYFYQPGAYSYNNDTLASPIVSITDGGILASPTLIIEDIHECRDTFALADSIYANQLTLNPIYPQAVCIPDTVFLSDASVSLLSSINSYTWQIGNILNSNVSDTFFILDQEGSFDLLFDVKDEFGCEQTLSLEDAILGDRTEVDFTVDTLSCTMKAVRFRDRTVADDITAWSWDFGDGNIATTKNPNHLYENEGVYSVCLTVENAIGCTKSLCKEQVVRISNPQSEFEGDTIFATCPPLLVNFSNLSSNGQQYIWDFGDNSGLSTQENVSHVFTEPGSYDIMLITELLDGCVDTLIKEDYIVIQGPLADFNMNATVGCKPLDVELFGSSNDFYTYIWDYGDGTIDSIPNLLDQHTTEYIYDEIGFFTPRLIVVDASGCARSFSGEEIEIVDLESSFELVDSILCGTETDISVINTSSSSRDIETYSWTLNGPETSTSDVSDPDFDISSLGQYDLELIAQIGTCLDTFSATGIVTVAAIPEAAFRYESDLFCEYVGVDFLDESNISTGVITDYSWDFGDNMPLDTLQNPVHSYSETGTFQIELTVTSDLGCTDSTQQSLTIDENVFITIEEDKTICIGDQTTISVDFNDSGVVDFYWLDNSNLSCTECLSQTVSPLDTTTFYFQTFYDNGCESLDSITINVVPIPSPTLEIIYDTLVCRNIEYTISVDNFDNSLTYAWFQNNEPIEGCAAGCESITVSLEENSNFVISVMNQYGCGNLDDFDIIVEESPNPIVSDDRSLCLGDTIQLSSTQGNNPVWQNNPELSCLSCPDPYVSPMSISSYIVSITSDIGCVFQDTVVVTPFVLDADAGDDFLICTDESISLQGTGLGNPNWSDSSGVLLGTEYELQTTPFVSQFLYLESQLGECIERDSLYVEIIEKASVFTEGDTICPGDVLQLDADGLFDEYIWQRVSDQLFLAKDQSISVAPRKTASYEVIASYRSCETDTAIAIVEVLPEVVIDLETDFEYYPNVPIQFEVIYNITSGYLFDWMPADKLSCADCPDPEVLELNRSQNFELNVFDPSTGCELDTSVFVRFNNECSPEAFYVPNIFSPNGDNVNDGFRVFAKIPEDFISLTIFNRWGEKMFYSENIEEEWDGIFKNKETLVDSYTYVVQARCERDIFSFAGTITLAR